MSLESAAAQLAAILAVIYLLDCFRWVARNAVIFRRVPPLPWSAGGLWQIARQFSRGLVFGFPLPPFGSLLTAEDWPFVAGSHGVRFVAWDTPAFALPSQAERLLTWDEVKQLSLDELELRLEGTVLHRFGSRRAARAVKTLLAALATAAPGKRGQLLREALERRFDPAEVQRRLKHFRARRLLLGVADVTLFLALFGLLGALMSGVVLQGWMLWAALGSWLFALVATTLAVRQLEKDLRPSWGALIISVVSPVSLMRSNDLVEPEWLAELHPAAVAVALLPAEAAARFVDARVRAARFPVKQESERDDAPALEDDAKSRGWHLEQLERLLKATGAAVEAPTGRHCPRCLTEYTASATACERCPGVTLAG